MPNQPNIHTTAALRLQNLAAHVRVGDGEDPEDPNERKNDGPWKSELDALRDRQNLARIPDPKNPGYIRQKEAGKLWIRERIDALVDAGSFREYGSIAGKAIYGDKSKPDMVTNFTPANFVAGSANLNGRPVIVGADDFSVRGGHADGAIANKALYTEQLALSFRIPMVRLIDGSSGGGSVTTLLEWGRTYIPPLIGMDTMIASLSEIPVVAAVLGPAVGLGAARAVLTHFSVIARSTGQLFAAGPPIVEHATFESVTKDELGGAEIQTANGSIDNLAPDEKTCFEQLRRFLSYLPSSTSRLPPAAAVWHAPNPPKALHLLIPHRRQRAFNVRTVVEGVVDQKSWFEIGEGWGDGVVVGLATLEGWPVGVLAGDCEKVGGVLTERGTAKLRRHIDLLDTFGLPLLNLVDQPGFAVGTEAEKEATIRAGATALAAIYQSTIPIFSVILRRVFGVAGGAFVDNRVPNFRVAWPSGDWGSLPLEGGVEAAYKRQLAAAGPKREELKAQLLSQFESIRSPLRTAEAFDIPEIIDPRDTRKRACEWAHLIYEYVLPERLARRKAAGSGGAGGVGGAGPAGRIGLYRP